MAKVLKKEIKFYAGKRKTAVAKLRTSPGKGMIFYNSLPYTELNLFHKLALAEPLRIYQREIGEDISFDFYITTSGGGKEGQIQAARLSLARALVDITGSQVLVKAFVSYDRHLLVQDARRKETRKPGDSKARAKRQKSYR